MKTVRRLFYADIVSAVAFVAAAFLSLFFFIDLVDELGSIGKNGYKILHAVAYSLLELPGHFYELSPIAVLIGTIYALARLAQSSEYTILRTGGLGPGRALSLLASLGLCFGLLSFVVGDYIAPWSEQKASQLQAYFRGGIHLGSAGAWLKDKQASANGEHNFFINVGSASASGVLKDVRIFEFNADNRLISNLQARSAQVKANSTWALQDVKLTRWSEPGAAFPIPTSASGVVSIASSASASAPGPNPALNSALNPAPRAEPQVFAHLSWQSGLSAEVVAAAVMPLDAMSTLELLRYVNHLSDNEQAVQQYQIRFWKRALYPFASLVMMALALPFAYMQSRSGGVSLKVFGGIMLGISFILLNNVAGHIGLLKNWTPWLVALTPSAIYLLMSMAAFAWLVRYR